MSAAQPSLKKIWKTNQNKTKAIKYQQCADSGAEAFEHFLTDFKTSPQETITTALGNITINEDDLSDDYDFMDEDDEAGQQRRRQQRRGAKEPVHKYKLMLQELADRKTNEVAIELDDIHTVCSAPITAPFRHEHFLMTHDAV